MKFLSILKENDKNIIAGIAISSIVLKVLLSITGNSEAGDTVLLVASIIGFIPLIISVIKSVLKGNFGIDILALLSIGGSILLGEYLASVIIVLMLSGGEILEDYAMNRSKRELTKLINSLPSTANVYEGAKLVIKQLTQVDIGTEIVIKQGEVVPIDGVLIDKNGTFDESNITGESIPVEKRLGDKIFSGSVAVDGPLTIETTNTSDESRYQQLVKLVKEAVEAKSPFVRLADRYSIWFTALALIISFIGFLISGGDPIVALSVLVVATPCPLILATPIAFSSGITIAAKHGAVFKSGTAIEQLAEFNYLVFDKTGTLTVGKPELSEIVWFEKNEDEKDILEAVSNIEKLSKHVLSESLTKLCKEEERHGKVTEFKEIMGQGVIGKYKGDEYMIGSEKLLKSNSIDYSSFKSESKYDEYLKVFVVKNNKLTALVLLKDKIKPNSKEVLDQIRTEFNVQPALLTGDKKSIAEEIGMSFGINEISAEALPEDKLKFIEDKQSEGFKVAMIGDGVNDAPAIAKADIGIALDTWGSSATTEAADVVMTNKDLNIIPTSIRISKGTLKVAKQGIWIGMGLSIVLMLIATTGVLPPTLGALSQEVIDLLVIVNALRVRNLV